MESILLGEREGWGERLPLSLSVPDRRSHLYAIGQTGVGKSTLLKSLILQDIEAGRGCALIDPHGDLAEELLDYIPRSRTDDVVYFDPAHLSHPPAFNPLAAVEQDERPLVAAGVVSAMRHVWASSWGPRSEYLLWLCTGAPSTSNGQRKSGTARRRLATSASRTQQSQTQSTTDTQTDSWSKGKQRSQSSAEAVATTSSRTWSRTYAKGRAVADGIGHSHTESTSESETESEGETQYGGGQSLLGELLGALSNEPIQSAPPSAHSAGTAKTISSGSAPDPLIPSRTRPR